MLTHYRRILEACAPYVIARRHVAERLRLAPLGVAIEPRHRFDPTHMASGPFIALVKRLDRLCYSPSAMGMPDWVMYDCAMIPGAIVGLGTPADALEPWVRRALEVPAGYLGLVPMSILITLPTPALPSWLIYSLCSVNQMAAGAAPEGLWRFTLALGAEVFEMRDAVCTTRWRSPHLGLYAGLGPLDVITAWTPSHDIRATATFRVPAGPDARRRLLAIDTPPPAAVDRYLDPDDRQALQSLQAEIETGLPVAIVGPAEIRGAETRVPLRVGAGGEPAKLSEPGFVRRFQG
jgi:hypothetical protein